MDPHNKNQLLNQQISKLQTEFILIDKGLCPNWSRETHRRQRDCLYLILGGKGKIIINGEVLYPVKNDMVLLPKNSMVSLYSENETCYNKYWCDFTMHFDGISLFDVIDFPYMVRLDDISYAKALFERLEELHLRTDVVSALLLKSAMLELIALFLQNDPRKSPVSIPVDPFVENMKTFINNNIHEELSVKILSNKMCFNEKYFISLFKKHFGTTPAHYIKTVRLEKAKQLLIYTDEKTSYIINKTGYSTPQKFSADFKKYTGFSPTEFRKNFK